MEHGQQVSSYEIFQLGHRGYMRRMKCFHFNNIINIDTSVLMISTMPYGMTISERLGRSSYKEQYAYLYR